MNGICPDEGLERRLLRLLVNADTEFQPWSALLFVNDFTPDESTTLADLEEPTWLAYSRRSLQADQWQLLGVTANEANAQWGESPIQWDNDSGPDETVYGYAIYDSLLSQLVLVQRFDPSDIREIETGHGIGVLPKFSYRSQTASE